MHRRARNGNNALCEPINSSRFSVNRTPDFQAGHARFCLACRPWGRYQRPAKLRPIISHHEIFFALPPLSVTTSHAVICRICSAP